MEKLRPWLPTLITIAGVAVVLFLQVRQGDRVERVEVETGLAPAPLSSGGDTSGGAPLDATTLRARVDRLEQELREVRREKGRAPRVAARAEQAGVEVASQATAGTPVLDAETAVADALASEDPEIREQLRAAVGEEMRRERDERFERRSERWKEQARERLSALAEEVGLEEEEVATVSQMVDAERDEIGALFRAARESGSWREAREEMIAVRERTDENVSAVIDDEKYEGWQKMREREREESGWMRRGRRTQGEQKQSR